MNRKERRNLERQTRSPKFKKLMKKAMEEKASHPAPIVTGTPTPPVETPSVTPIDKSKFKITGKQITCHLCGKGDGTLMKYETPDGQKGYVHFKCADMMMKAIEKDRLERLGIKIPEKKRLILPTDSAMSKVGGDTTGAE